MELFLICKGTWCLRYHVILLAERGDNTYQLLGVFVIFYYLLEFENDLTAHSWSATKLLFSPTPQINQNIPCYQNYEEKEGRKKRTRRIYVLWYNVVYMWPMEEEMLWGDNFSQAKNVTIIFLVTTAIKPISGTKHKSITYKVLGTYPFYHAYWGITYPFPFQYLWYHTIPQSSTKA